MRVDPCSAKHRGRNVDVHTALRALAVTLAALRGVVAACLLSHFHTGKLP